MDTIFSLNVSYLSGSSKEFEHVKSWKIDGKCLCITNKYGVTKFIPTDAIEYFSLFSVDNCFGIDSPTKQEGENEKV